MPRTTRKGRRPPYWTRMQKQRILDCWAGYENAEKSRAMLKREMKKHVPVRTFDTYLSELVKEGKLVRTARGLFRLPKFTLGSTAALALALENRVDSRWTIPLTVDIWATLGNFPPPTSLNAKELKNVERAQKRLAEAIGFLDSVRRSYCLRETRRHGSSERRSMEHYEEIVGRFERLAELASSQRGLRADVERECGELESVVDQMMREVQEKVMPPELRPFALEPLVATVAYVPPALEVDTSGLMIGMSKTRKSHHSLLYHYLLRSTENGVERLWPALKKRDLQEAEIRLKLKRLGLDSAGIQSRAMCLLRYAMLRFVNHSLGTWYEKLEGIEAMSKRMGSNDETWSTEEMLRIVTVLGPKTLLELTQAMEERRWFRRIVKSVDRMGKAVLAPALGASRSDSTAGSVDRATYLGELHEEVLNNIVDLEAQRVAIDIVDDSELLELSVVYPTPHQLQLDRWELSPQAIATSIFDEARQSPYSLR